MNKIDGTVYLNSTEAAQKLGVSLATLYAYVSRKRIRSMKVPGSRKRLYAIHDIERLAETGHGEGVSSAPSALLTSEITLLTDKALYYRGKDARSLADTATLEEVAELIWQAPRIFESPLRQSTKEIRTLRNSVRQLPMAEQASALFPVIERLEPKAYDLSPEGYATTGVDTVRWLAAFLCELPEPVTTPVHQLIGERWNLNDHLVDLVRRLLVLCVDYDPSFTALAVRSAANAGVSPYLAVVIGYGTFRGRRLRFGRAEIISLFLQEILTTPDPRKPVLTRYRLGEPLPGFEDPALRESDPRVNYLLTHIHRLFANDGDTQRLLITIETAYSAYGRTPEFILLLLFVERKLGMSDKQLGISGLARSVGWLAHANEQYQAPTSRPQAVYTGALPEV